MINQVPDVLKVEHEHLHAELARAALESGALGEAAREEAVQYPAAVLVGEYLELALRERVPG